MTKAATKKITPASKKAKKTVKVDPNFEPNKVALMVACVAATSLVLFAVISVSTLKTL